MPKRIIILGDSLAMPRPDDNIKYEDTYSYLLQNNNCEVINRSKRSNDSKIQTNSQNILDDIVYLNPNIVIIHLGIVDCAPRLFTRNEARVLSVMPNYLSKIIISFFSKYRYIFTKIRQISYVGEVHFKKNLEYLIKKLQSLDIDILIIKILETNQENIRRSYKFEENIHRYNLIISKISHNYNIREIDINGYDNILLKDGIHINKSGHNAIYKKLKGLV